jgi:hypothetical protein
LSVITGRLFWLKAKAIRWFSRPIDNPHNSAHLARHDRTSTHQQLVFLVVPLRAAD